MTGELGLDRCGVADEQQADLQMPGGDERTVDDDGRPGIAAHGIDGYAQALLFDGLYLTSGVIAAARADLVRQLGLVALRALAAADRLQRVVGAALRRPGLRMSAFGIRHD